MMKETYGSYENWAPSSVPDRQQPGPVSDDVFNALEGTIEVSQDVSVRQWFVEGWRLYREDWLVYTAMCSLFTLPVMAFHAIQILWTLHFISPKTELELLPGKDFSITINHHELIFEMAFTLISLAMLPLSYGLFIAGSNVMRCKIYGSSDIYYTLTESSEEVRLSTHHYQHLRENEKVPAKLLDFFRGYFLFGPLLWLNIVVGLLVGVGLLLLLLPGIYLMVTLSYSCLVYIEYHHRPQPDLPALRGRIRNASGNEPVETEDYSEKRLADKEQTLVRTWQAMWISWRVVHGSGCFWKIVGFLLACAVLNGLSWALVLVPVQAAPGSIWAWVVAGVALVGPLLCGPFTGLATVVSFRQLFGLLPEERPRDRHCYCCRPCRLLCPCFYPCVC